MPDSSGKVLSEHLLTSLEPNILIDGSGHARVCDFGLASITRGKYTPAPRLRSDGGYTERWSAPEILSGEGTASEPADVFAFGMVVIEVRAPSENRRNTTNRVLTLS